MNAPLSSGLCEAKMATKVWDQTLRRDRPVGTPCRSLAVATVGGHALCWTHEITVRLGRATLGEVLAGTREPNPADHGGRGNRR